MMEAVKNLNYNEELATHDRTFNDDELKRISKMSKELEFKNMLQQAASKIIYGILIIAVGAVVLNIL